MKKQKGQNVLTRIRKLFPKVKSVHDSNKSINIEVTAADSHDGKKKNPESCALARACIREKIADHAIIGIGMSYLIKNNVATRYKTSVAVGREITSFDRHHDFQAGRNYRLSKISRAQRLGEKVQGDKPHGPRLTKKPGALAVHRTENIRVVGH